jgi:arthrofactin-type cyclic lipopeptide synthetase C
LIDTEPPETPHEAGTSHIFNQFVGVFESIFDRTLYVNETIIASCEIELFISNLHAALVKARCLPARSTPDVLRGSLATFAAACRTTYVPHGLYTGKLHLVLVSAACRNKSFNDDVTRQRAAYAVQWRRWAAELDVWYGPGHHFSILQVPHVRSLATWWRQARDLESAPGT